MSRSKVPQLAADIGGTFTDIVLEAGGRLHSAKVLTTHEAPAAGVLRGVNRVLQSANVRSSEVGIFVHGTTLAANAIIERRGAPTALITTQGHRDALETGYENRFDQYDVSLTKPVPLVPRHRRWPVEERMSAHGRVLVPLDERSVHELVDRLRENEIQSVAIGLLHSYANPAHEKKIADILQAALPSLWITMSSEVSPEIREYDRLSTAVANAYVRPLMASYLHDLQHQLVRDGFSCPLLLVMSSGGLTTVDVAIKHPVRLVESGPAGGAILAAEIARQLGLEEVIAFDMGGTTAKLCLIDRFNPQRSGSFEVDRMHRFIRGSGLPLRIPTIEMVEIGAGGGSIAGMDDLGRLRVGPRSASAEPGPACYGRGGAFPTVTDADVLLGRLDCKGFAGGLFDLQPESANTAMRHHVGNPLGMEPSAAAAAVCEVVDETMANAARVHAVESGKDVSQRTLIASGGAAPLHAARVAEKLGITRVVIPSNAAVGSAIGFLLAPVSFEVSRSWLVPIEQLDCAAVEAILIEMREPVAATVRQAAPGQELVTELTAHMRYAAQRHEVEAHLPVSPTPDSTAFREAFESRYIALYGRLIPNVAVNLVTLTIKVSAVRLDVEARTSQSSEHAPTTPAADSLRQATVSRDGPPMTVPAYVRAGLSPGSVMTGPAIITEEQTTTIVPAGVKASVDAWGNILMERAGQNGE